MTENRPKSVFVFKFEDLLALLNNETVEVQCVRVINTKCVQVIHRAKSTEYLETSKDTNIFVAATTTAWARIRLYKELDKLGERALYCDTDSVIYKKSNLSNENLEIGNFLGDMTNELDDDDWIVDFVSAGPKNYGYKTKKGKCVVKVKGFSLNCTNAPVFSFENIKQLVLTGIETPEARVPLQPAKKRKLELESLREEFRVKHEAVEEPSALVCPRGMSVYNPWRIIRTRKWQICQGREQKLNTFQFTKRIILSNGMTIPYGFCGTVNTA
jgi:hypothetical protein